MSDGQAPRRPLRAIVYDLLCELEESQGEVTPALDAIEADLAVKVDAYAAVYKQLKAEADAHAEVEAYYAAKRAARIAAADRLRDYMLVEMQRLNADKLKGVTGSARVQYSERVEVADEAAFIAKYRDDPDLVRTTMSLNRKGIAEFLKHPGSASYHEHLPNEAAIVRTPNVVFR